ncbi:MAG: type 1 glutamine amidotransferase [Streptococcaceae bacterium]|jgi:CobQ-like glutamine amidotransferase family enzyme|nr:type 1 glutamine amidotransferase [Streptococcaceae bacterium]
MTYISLQTEHAENYSYHLHIAHLYGDLMNTYGDNGNILLLKYIAEKLGAATTFEIVSLKDAFKAEDYDLAFWGGGQDYEQSVVSEDSQRLHDELSKFIETGKPMLAICGGFQLLGDYYVQANGKRLEGTKALPHYTLNQDHNRFIGDIEIHNDEFDETYYGFENHNGRTFLQGDEKALGHVVYGQGNNDEDGTEGLHYKHTFGSYFHGPLLSRNPRIAYRLVMTALQQKYPDAEFPPFEDKFADLEDKVQVTDVKRKAEAS